MEVRLSYTGDAGELRWKYRQVATLSAWTLTLNGTGLDLTANVVGEYDDQATTTQPSKLTFRVVRQNHAPWDWPVETLHIADGVLRARLTQTE